MSEVPSRSEHDIANTIGVLIREARHANSKGHQKLTEEYLTVAESLMGAVGGHIPVVPDSQSDDMARQVMSEEAWKNRWERRMPKEMKEKMDEI